jgi:hypothetical protein
VRNSDDDDDDDDNNNNNHYRRLPIGSLSTVARPATTRNDPSTGDMVFPNLCNHVVVILVVSEVGG